MIILFPVAAAALCFAPNALPDRFEPPPPPGPFAVRASGSAGGAGDFREGSPVVATTYFYWYDADSKAHVVDADGTDALTDHPPVLRGFSYKNVDWHAAQLRDMIAAGVDVALPVYWGDPVGGQPWSDSGLPKLIEARQQLLRAGERPPAIGMFYDTSTLRHNGGGYHIDLRTAAGTRWFFATIRNFFSLIPPEHRATIDGRPLVLLYSPGFAAGVDGRLFPAVRRMFREQFGADLFLVKMVGWPGDADSQYMWGGALRPQWWETAGLGPGYDHSAVPGRAPLVRDREDGRYYMRSWETLLRQDPARRAWLVHLETWNEFHEGTEICESREHGRRYINLTRPFTDQFHAGRRLPPLPRSRRSAVVFATPGQTRGIEPMPQPQGDGALVTLDAAGERAWRTAPTARSPRNRYLYFDVDDAFLPDAAMPIEVAIRYLDAGPTEFWFEYDSDDPELTGVAQAFRRGFRQPLVGSNTWKEARFAIPYPRFSGRSNGADFRIGCCDADLTIRGVTVRRSNDK